MSKFINITLITLALIGLQACSGNKYLSQPASAEFRVDGEASEWAGRFQMPKNEKFAIGISHDKNYLYLAINSMDRAFERQLAMRGLTVWVDSKGKKHETLGLRFQSKISMDMRPGSAGNRMNRSPGTNTREDMLRDASPFKGDLDLIVIDAKGRESLGPNDLMASAVAGDAGLFIEYQIPLAMLGEDYIAGQPIGIGINSEFDKSSMPNGGKGGMSAGGMSGGGRGSGGGGGGKRGGGGGHSGGQGSRPDQTDLDVWVKVELSQP